MKALQKFVFIGLTSLVMFFGGAGVAVSQVDFREETIYFLLTTRFFDGDPSNNVPNEWSSYNPDPNINPSITDPQDVTWRGDFKGLMEKLDYIQDLGFTAIWITPIVHNRSPLDYHGYHAWDFTRVDPRLESPGATFQDLINAVHARGMKIVLDIVTNHSGRFGIKGHAEMKYNNDPNQPWGRDKNGNPLPDNPDWEYDGLTPNPDDGKIWSRANIAKLPPPYNQNLAAYNWPNSVTYINTSDPDWWHHSGNGFAQGYDDTENLYNRALHEDTPDLNTGSTVVRQYLLDAYRTFIEMGVDGFRWDTIKHMSREDVLWFLDAFKEINPDLFIFGEVAQKRHELHNVEEINPHWYTWRGAVGNSPNSGMAVLDFYAMATFHMFEKGESFANVMAAGRYDHLYSDPSTLVTFLDNHDFGPNNDWNRRYGGDARNLTAALNFMWTWRGIPTLYYGTEVQFMRGQYADIQYGGHQRSIDETGRAYFGPAFENAPNHVVYQHIRKLNAIRRAVPALQKGSWRWGGNGGSNGVGIIREHGDSYAIVGLAKDGQVTFNFSGIRNGTYRDAVTGHEISVSNGSIRFTVAPSSAGIYVLNGPGRIGDLGAGFFQTDASGSQGDGGGDGGGGSGPATVTINPNPAVAGQSVTITYDGFLNSASQVNYYGGINSWTSIQTRPMAKSGEIWTVTFTVPASATELNFVFNNGSGTWDNNGGADYRAQVTGGDGGGDGGGDPEPTFTVTPNPPVSGQSMTMTYNGSLATASQVNLHWGFDGWTNVTTTPMQKIDGVWKLTMTVPAAVSRELNFVFNNGAGTWDNNSNNDYKVAVATSTSTDQIGQQPTTFALLGNYPNPFNPQTSISFILPETGRVRLQVFDTMGRVVEERASAILPSGQHAMRFDGAALSSGVYLYRMEFNGEVLTGKMTLVK
jgi:glycosidase